MDDGLYIGLISGTSVDGVDAVLASFSQQQPTLIASHLHPFPAALRNDVLALFVPGANEIDRLGEVDCAVGSLLADAVEHLLRQAGVTADQVIAIGSHGQTIRHRPKAQRPFTMQIGNPFILAERTGIDVVWDFRRRDMALGGQGAPLAPLFHQAFMADPAETRVALNLGGIANITLLPAEDRPALAFDTGPANGLMDAWIQRIQGAPYDQSGAWAASASADPLLLQRFLTEPYFKLPAPKSTGKELFHLLWAESLASLSDYDPAVVQATFMALTCESVAMAIESYGGCDRVLVSGGGIHNRPLIQKLAQRLSVPVESSARAGIEPDWLEAMAFAWLAMCFKTGKAVNTPAFTGARKASVLGSLVPGSY